MKVRRFEVHQNHNQCLLKSSAVTTNQNSLHLLTFISTDELDERKNCPDTFSILDEVGWETVTVVNAVNAVDRTSVQY